MIRCLPKLPLNPPCLLAALVSLVSLATHLTAADDSAASRRPNLLVIVADQWRAQAFGYAGDPNVRTPHLDQLKRQSVHFVNAVAGMPVCSPTRASFLTGQRPLTHGVFLNDVPLDPQAVTIAKVTRAAGYDTGFIGKWHVDGRGRSNFIPRERRQGFDYWKVLECTHNYNRSFYYADEATRLTWPRYDAQAQTEDACGYLRNRAGSSKPFLLFLAWGPPHNPYETAPDEYRAMYDAATLRLRPNVPPALHESVRGMLAGYYAHATALDDCVARIRDTLRETGLEEDTVLVFTADHGDMLGSQGQFRKQKPHDESARVPMLIHWPRGLGVAGREVAAPMNSEDLMPTLLGLAGLAIPPTVEGLNYADYARGGANPGNNATVLLCASPFGEWERRTGGKEYRGIRTPRHTYVRDLDGPWLLFDNETDPYQTNNLVNLPAQEPLQARLDALLQTQLKQHGDAFKPGPEYIRQWGYTVNERGTVPYDP
jgi:arylsulfatase A-like enzyme